MRKMMQLFHRSDRYFAMDADGIQEHNWRRVRLMTGIYLIALAVYFFAVCLPGGNDTQTTAVLAAIAAQGIYSLLVWKKKERPESSFAENGIILFFGGMIIAEAVGLGAFIFKENSAWFFPIALILLTQIYIMPPREKVTELTVYTVLFIFCVFLTKSSLLAGVDTIAAVAAYCIGTISYFASLNTKIESFETRLQLRRMCSVDAMTGLLNKNTFEYYFHEFTRRVPSGHAYALAIMDIDRFKAINDERGHLAGDLALQGVTAVINKAFPDSADAEKGRFGGDEFVILLKNTAGGEETEKFFRNFLAEMARELVKGTGIPVTGSIGAVILKRPDVPFSAAFLSADRMLYAVKENGGNSALVTVSLDNRQEKPYILTVDFPKKEMEVAAGALGKRYHVLRADTLRETVATIERYQNGLSAVFIHYEPDSWTVTNLKQELDRMSRANQIPLVLVTAGGHVPPEWKKRSSMILQLPLDAEAYGRAAAEVCGRQRRY